MMKRGEIWIVDKRSETVDSGDSYAVDLRGRPVVIISNDIGNEHSPTIEVVPLTTRSHHFHLPTHIRIMSSYRISYAMCENITTIDKSSLFERIGKLTSDEISRLNAALLVSIGIT